MPKGDQNDGRSKRDLTILSKQLEKLRQAAISNATLLNSQNPSSVLQALLSVDFPIKNVGDQKFIDAIVSGSKTLVYDDTPFKDFCQLICKVFSKQIKPSTLKQSAYNCVVTFLLENFNATSDAETKVDILRALSIVLYDNPNNNTKNLEDLVPLLIQVADKSTRPLEVRRMAINCLGNLCCNAGSKMQPYYSVIFDIVMSNISTVDHTSQGTTMIVAKSLDFNDQALRRVASSTLRSLHLLLYEDKSIITNKLVDIVEIVRKFVFYNINPTTYKHSKDDTLMNSMQMLPHQHRLSHLRQQEQNKRLSTLIPFNNLSANKEFGLVSSDSEISDSEAINPGSRKHRDNAKIRINALLCLQAIAKTSPRSFYPYWENFIPHHFDPFVYLNRMKTNDNLTDRSLASYLSRIDHPQSLFTILLFDPAPTVRQAVSNALMSILDGSKQYLSVAAERDAKSTSFTSLSEKVAAIARDLHNGLWCALEMETNLTITVQLFKCLGLLIQNSSYDRLAKGYIPKIYKKLLQYIDNSDQRVAIGALSTLYFLLDNKSAAEEIRTCVRYFEPQHGQDHLSLDAVQLDVDLFTYMQEKILKKSAEPSEPANIVLESWNILSACTRTQPVWLPEIWKLAEPSFPEILSNDDVAVRCGAVRFLNNYAMALNDRTQVQSDTTMNLSWWTTMLERYIQQAIQDTEYQVRATACDCMSVISQDVFETMAPRRQRLCISLLLPLAEDPHADVRAAACHALGALVVFPSLREDPMFTSDVALAMLQQLEDKSLFVKVRASWTLANLCDALVLEQHNSQDFHINDTLSLELWCKIALAAANAANDNDKLKSNGVRALGSVTRIAPLEYLNSLPGRRCISPIMAAVTKNIESGTLKARWNACHAAGNILRNTHFPIGAAEHNRWTVPFYEALMKSLKQCKNFKVRIHACAALGIPIQQSQFGDVAMFDKVISSVQESLQEMDQDLPDISFMEIRYKEQLKEQLDVTLAQLNRIK